MREMSASEPLMKHRKHVMASKPGPIPCPGKSVAATYLLAMRRPVFRRHDSHSGFRTELETLVDDVKGKRASGEPVRRKVLMHRPGADCPIVVMKPV
jgi:hypothetical protein